MRRRQAEVVIANDDPPDESGGTASPPPALRITGQPQGVAPTIDARNELKLSFLFFRHVTNILFWMSFVRPPSLSTNRRPPAWAFNFVIVADPEGT